MKITALFLLMFLLLGFASAAYGTNPQSNDVPNSTASNSSGIGQELNQEVRGKIAELKEGNYSGALGKELDVKSLAFNLLELRTNNVKAKTQMKINAETDENNKTNFKAQLSNGKESEIKIMPDAASETAISRLKLKVCSEENNCTIELKEVGKEDETKAAYDVKAQKQVKILGLFKAKMNVEANVDAETGEIISSNVPWWASISSETD